MTSASCAAILPATAEMADIDFLESVTTVGRSDIESPNAYGSQPKLFREKL